MTMPLNPHHLHDHATAVTASPRRIGIALGGGAARGWAHIGVIRELLAQGIVPSVVAGTSIGAIVGASYAADRLDRLEDFARSLSVRRVLTLMDFSFAGTGLVKGDRLRQQLQHDLGGFSVETLPLPFTAVAAEMATGHEVWLSKGDLVESLRASYALPGLFEPVHIGGRWLFDGAVVNPIPVSVCRAMGADLVIAINVSGDCDPHPAPAPSLDSMLTGTASPNALAAATAIDAASQIQQKRRLQRPSFFMKQNKDAPSIANVMMEAFNIAQERISRSRLAENPPDIMINAKLRSCGMFDFHRAADLISHGRLAVHQAMPEIEAHLTGSLSNRI
ncbi:MAG: patatin-like phospholipase family protein [Beijerinckiaceae bacterium]|jgi:NTE family protein